MEDGESSASRARFVRSFVPKLTGTSVLQVDLRCEDPSLAERLHDGNRCLAELGADERPTFSFLHDIGDPATLNGLWQRDGVTACARPMLSDERAYTAA